MNDFSALRDRGAVVTGAGRGIGAAVARALAAAGAHVVLAARTAEEIDAVARGIIASGGNARSVVCDVTDEAGVARLAGAAASGRPIDILVNNAGASMSAPLARTSLDEWNRMLAINATGPFLCTRAFLPGMLERGWGRVVNVASMVGLEGARYVSAYSASKHAVVGFTKSLALEVADTGVTCNAVCPAYVDTPMTERTIRNVTARTGRTAAEALDAVLRNAGQPRLVAPEEVAAAILQLCISGADVNGRCVVIDGSASEEAQ